MRTKKKDPYQTRATMGGNLINYPDDVGTPIAILLLIKIFLNSVISTKGAKFANADLARTLGGQRHSCIGIFTPSSCNVRTNY